MRLRPFVHTLCPGLSGTPSRLWPRRVAPWTIPSWCPRRSCHFCCRGFYVRFGGTVLWCGVSFRGPDCSCLKMSLTVSKGPSPGFRGCKDLYRYSSVRPPSPWASMCVRYVPGRCPSVHGGGGSPSLPVSEQTSRLKPTPSVSGTRTHTHTHTYSHVHTLGVPCAWCAHRSPTPRSGASGPEERGGPARPTSPRKVRRGGTLAQTHSHLSGCL